MLEVFRDLEISGTNQPTLSTFVAALSKALPVGWKRDTAREKQLGRNSGDTHYSFSIAARQKKPAAHLFLMRRGAAFHITNIVPDKMGELGRKIYNNYVEEFRQICEPVAKRLGLTVRVTSDQQDISELLTPRAMKALQSFSSSANMGSLHPFDEERWRKFLLIAHHDKVQLDSETLNRWLAEVWRWPDSGAQDLASEYDFARTLLDEYDGGAGR